MNKIKVLHVTLNNEFFDPIMIAWEKNEEVENKAVLIVNVLFSASVNEI